MLRFCLGSTAVALLFSVFVACDKGGGGDKDVAADVPVVGEVTPTGDAVVPGDDVAAEVAGEVEVPLTCAAKDTEVADFCAFAMWSCFDPSGPCTEADGGVIGYQWENGAKMVLEGIKFNYYAADGTLCLTTWQTVGGPDTFKDASSGDECKFQDEEGTSCVTVTCPDGSTEIVDSNDMDALLFKDAGQECFE